MNWTDEVEDDDAIIQTVFLKVDGLKKPLSLLTGWRTNSCKEVIVKNRQLREEQYQKRKELDKQMAIEKEKEMLKTMQA